MSNIALLARQLHQAVACHNCGLFEEWLTMTSVIFTRNFRCVIIRQMRCGCLTLLILSLWLAIIAASTLLPSPDRAYISLALMLAGVFVVACWPDDGIGDGVS